MAFYNHILEVIGCSLRAEEAIDITHRDPVDRSLELWWVGRGPDFDWTIA